MIGLGMTYGILGNLYRILIAILSIDRDIDLLCKYFQLVNRSRTVHVTSHKQRTLALLRLELPGKLTRKSSLTRTLQSRHKYHRRIAGEIDLSCLTTHKPGKLVMYNLHHEFTRLDGIDYILPHGLALHLIGKLLGNLEVNVSFQQGTTHILKGFGYIDFGDLTFTFQYLEAPFEPFA